MARLPDEHPWRALLAREIHTRPHPQVVAPARITHLAKLTGETTALAERARIAELCERYNAPPPPEDALHYAVMLGDFRLIWERHTEFSTYSVLARAVSAPPFRHNAIDLLPEDWRDDLAGKTIAACHIVLEARGAPEHAPEDLAELFEGQRLMASRVMDGAAIVWTAFRVHADRFGRYLVRDQDLTPEQAGRLAQRIWELDTYTMMALLALPVARVAQPELADAEARLARVARATADLHDLASERTLLEELLQLAGRVEQMVASSAYRYGAARAYDGIVSARLRELREAPHGGLQPLGEFLERRFQPAMRTCRSMEARQDGLSQRLARTADLLRTRVDLQLEAQNQALLASMERRARLQLRLQQMVEGLSVVAISYYVLGLLAYLVKGISHAPVGLPADVGLALAMPFVVAAVWLALRRMKRTLGVDDHA